MSFKSVEFEVNGNVDGKLVRRVVLQIHIFLKSIFFTENISYKIITTLMIV